MIGLILMILEQRLGISEGEPDQTGGLPLTLYLRTHVYHGCVELSMRLHRPWFEMVYGTRNRVVQHGHGHGPGRFGETSQMRDYLF